MIRVPIRICLSWLRSPTFWLITAAVLIAVPSLAFPFGRDQALHYYIGRFALAGLVPFRDAFDTKPPGIYLLYMIGVLLFGVGQVAIRTFDLLATVGVGVLAAAAFPDGLRRRALVGASVLLSVAYYYTVFDFWNTAQPDHFEGLLLLAALVIVLRCRLLMVAAVASALCTSAAVLFKTPAVVPALGIAGVLVWRALYREADRGLGTASLAAAVHFATGLAIGLLCVGCFAAMGALNGFCEGMISYTRYYQQYLYFSPESRRLVIFWFWCKQAFSATMVVLLLCLLGTILTIRRRDWGALGVAIAAALLTLLCAISIAWQGKFFIYHWTVMTPFLSVAAVFGLRAMKWQTVLVSSAVAGTLICLFAGPRWMAVGRAAYLKVSAAYWLTHAGAIDRHWLASAFRFWDNFSYADNETIGAIIRKRARAGDRLHVSCFEPVPYVIADLPSPSRFPAEQFLVPPEREGLYLVKDDIAYFDLKRWQSQHWSAIWTARPRFFVAHARDERLHKELIERRYIPVKVAGRYALFETSK